MVQPHIRPPELSEGALDDFLPGPIGEWNGERYAVGLWDAADSIYACRSVLEAYDIRIPTLEDPWAGDEFDAGHPQRRRPERKVFGWRSLGSLL